jgi:hypothetical protein
LFRDRVYYGGLLALNARKSTLPCTLGARIEFGGSALLSNELDFAIDRKSLSCHARLV